jgi:hypothetical protein
MAQRQRSVAAIFLVWTASVLPLYLQPMRLESNEPHSAGFVILLALAAVTALILEPRLRATKPARALLAFAAVVLVTSLFALSPVTALAGDLIRRFGALAQMAVLAGAMIGAWAISAFEGKTLARLMWMAGLIVTTVTLLQQARLYPTISPTYYPLRSSGTLGYPTYLGGWVALCVMVCSVYAPFGTQRLKQVVWWFGILFIAASLVAAGARAGTLALGAGWLTLILAYAAVTRRRWVVAIVVLAVVLAVIGLPIVSGVQGIPLLQRLDLSVQGNATQAFREIISARAIELVENYPAMMDYNGALDQFAGLRPLFGYGTEMQELLYRQFPSIAGYSVDRAHNLWLDTLLTGGWLTLIGRVALLVGIGGWVLRRLGLRNLSLLPPVIVGFVMGGFVARESAWLPVSVTLGGIVGLWVGLLIQAMRPQRARQGQIDAPAMLALGVLVVFLVDLQFGFETTVVSLTFWIACGALFAQRGTAKDRIMTTGLAPYVGGAMLGAAVLIRAIAYNAPNSDAMFISALLCTCTLVGGLVLVSWFEGWRWTWRGIFGTVVLIAAGLGFGWLGARPASPLLLAAWDLALVVGGSVLLIALVTPSSLRAALLHIQASWSPRYTVAVLVVGIGAVVWWLDIAGDIHFKRGNLLRLEIMNAEEVSAGLTLRPWDVTALSLYGAHAINEAINAEGDALVGALERAQTSLYAAAHLHPFNASNTLRLANLETAFAQLAVEPAPYIERADTLLAAAAAQDPYRWEVAFARAHFAWQLLQDRDSALEYITSARLLNSDAAPLMTLQAEIETWQK